MAQTCLTVLFQNADDLVFGEPATLHLWSFRLGQSLPQTGLGGGDNVTTSGSGLFRSQSPGPRFGLAHVRFSDRLDGCQCSVTRPEV